MGAELTVYTAFLHKGEEPGISGRNGSGTIFFSGCNLKCLYCQNYKFSHHLEGRIITEEELAHIMLALEAKGAHNINLVTPTHFLPQILKSLLLALKKGLSLPIVYNTSGYEKPEIIELIKDVIDIFLPDMKYHKPAAAEKYSHALDYPTYNQESIKVIYRYKKETTLWEGGLLKGGLVIRHLVLPNQVEEAIKILNWIKEYTPKALVSIMFQYQPYFKANLYPDLKRMVKEKEYEEVVGALNDIELKGWVQDLSPQEELAGVHFLPALDTLLHPVTPRTRMPCPKGVGYKVVH